MYSVSVNLFKDALGHSSSDSAWKDVFTKLEQINKVLKFDYKSANLHKASPTSSRASLVPSVRGFF